MSKNREKLNGFWLIDGKRFGKREIKLNSSHQWNLTSHFIPNEKKKKNNKQNKLNPVPLAIWLTLTNEIASIESHEFPLVQFHLSKSDKAFFFSLMISSSSVRQKAFSFLSVEVISIEHWSIAYDIHFDHILNQSIWFQLHTSAVNFFLRLTFCVRVARGLLFLQKNILLL